MTSARQSPSFPAAHGPAITIPSSTTRTPRAVPRYSRFAVTDLVLIGSARPPGRVFRRSVMLLGGQSARILTDKGDVATAGSADVSSLRGRVRERWKDLVAVLVEHERDGEVDPVARDLAVREEYLLLLDDRRLETAQRGAGALHRDFDRVVEAALGDRRKLGNPTYRRHGSSSDRSDAA